MDLSNLKLSYELASRDIQAKYKRSVIGLSWLFITPLALLIMYTFVFGTVLGVDWKVDPALSTNKNLKLGFILPFFIGLSVYLFISDVVNSSTNLYVSKRNLVNKTSFPLWVLCMSNLIRALFVWVGSLILVFIFALYKQTLSFEGGVLAIVILVLIVFFSFFLSMLISSISPFIGDISEVFKLVMRGLFYVTPITYPISYVSEKLQLLLWINPLTNIIEPLRGAILFGKIPSFHAVLIFSFFSMILALIGVYVYKKLERVIPDVV